LKIDLQVVWTSFVVVNISLLFITVSQWNLVTYYNISDYEQNYAEIKIYYNNLKNICDKYQPSYEKLTETCSELQKINFQILNKINEDHEEFNNTSKLAKPIPT